MNEQTTTSRRDRLTILLLLSIFTIASCGLVYELIAGTLSSYLLGNSVTQFSIVIGMFLTAMGIGSFLNRFVEKHLLFWFVVVELAIGFIGGCSALVLFGAFAVLGNYWLILVGICTTIGALIGLEVPLLVRILRERYPLKSALSNVLSLDYLGALAASLLFPFVLVPHLGLVRTGFLFGFLNVVVAGLVLFALDEPMKKKRFLRVSSIGLALVLVFGFVSSGRTTTFLEDMLYDDEVLFATTTPYQRIVVTRWRDDLRLYLDGNIQFSSVDEHRYHEALVHPAMGLVHGAQSVLILGGGDGMAAREVLKYPTVKRIDLVDLDEEMTRLFSTAAPLVRLNRNALTDSRVTILNEDAQKFLERSTAQYDVIILDLPDPNHESLGKLYSRSFYRLVAKHVSAQGVFVTQSTSPYYATEAFWCIVNTIADTTTGSTGKSLITLPYHAYVPSFGDWGFVLAAFTDRTLSPEQIRLTVSTRYLSEHVIPTLFVFDKEVGPRQTEINRLDNQVLVRLYERGFRRFNQ